MIDGIGRKIEQLGATMDNMAGRGSSAFGTVGQAVGASLVAIGGLVAAGAGVFAFLDHMATSTATYALTVEQTSNRLGIAIPLVQTLYQAGNLLGLSTSQVNVALQRFSVQLESSGMSLKRYGLSLHDLHITTSDLGGALLQLSDWYQQTTDQTAKAAVTTALFGRNIVALSNFLSLGRAGIGQLTQEFRDMGLVLSDGQIQLDATAKVILDKLHLEIQGLQMTIGNALIPAFIDLWSILGKVLNPAGQFASTAEAITNALKQAVIWVAAFVSALTGVKLTLNDINSGQNATTALLAMGGAAADGTAPVETLAQTVAGLQDQISTLTDSQQQFDDGMQAQTDAIKAQQTAYDDLTQSQLNSLDAQKQAIDLAFQQWNQQNAANDAQSKLAADQALLAKESQKAGFDPTSLKQQVVADQNNILRQQATIQVDAAKHQIDLEKQTIEQTKKLKDDAWKDDIARLDSIKKTTDQSYKDQIKGLQDQVKEAQKADAALTASNNQVAQQDQQNTNATTLAALDSQRAITHGFVPLRDAATSSFADAAKAGTDAFNTISKAVNDMDGAMRSALVVARILGAIFTAWFFQLSTIAKGFMLIAQAIGWVVGKLQDMARAILSMPQPLQSIAEGAVQGLFSKLIPGFDQGGIVSGQLGQPQLAIVHGGERISTPDQQIVQQHSGGGSDAETLMVLRQILAVVSGSGSNGQFMTVMRALMQQMNSQGARGVRGAGFFPQ